MLNTIVKEPVMKGHLLSRDTFVRIFRCPLKTGFTVFSNMNQHISRNIIIKDLRLDLRSWLPDLDQLRGRTELIKSPRADMHKGFGSALSFPEASPKGAKVYPASRRRSNKRVGLKGQLAPHCVL